DDNKDLSAALALTLSAAGYRVETSAGFKDALARDLDRTDLVICDMQLGDGFGLDLVRSMRANGHSVTAIALSGYSSDADQEASKRAGFVAHLSKPVDVERLLTTVRRAISRDRGVAKNTV
ncbi:MAG TPA: response regulator, partial [Polyangia bacterium]